MRPILHNLFLKLEKDYFPTHFMRPLYHNTKSDKVIARKLINAKFPNKILANQVWEYVKIIMS